jgi:hypothetical protein
MSRRKIDWDAIKTEYVTGDISIRELEKKYKLEHNNLAKHSKNEGWVKARKDYRTRATTKAVTKSCDKRANELSKVLDSSMLIRDRIYEAMNDPQQFNRYLVTRGRKGGEFETVEEVHEKVDTKAIREMTHALKELENLEDPKAAIQKAIDIITNPDYGFVDLFNALFGIFNSCPIYILS